MLEACPQASLGRSRLILLTEGADPVDEQEDAGLVMFARDFSIKGQVGGTHLRVFARSVINDGTDECDEACDALLIVSWNDIAYVWHDLDHVEAAACKVKSVYFDRSRSGSDRRCDGQ